MPPNEGELVVYEAGAGEDLSSSGTVKANAAALEVGAWYTLFVGAERVRFAYGATEAGAKASASIAATPLGADAQHPWQVEEDTQYVALIHYDGSGATAFSANLRKSSPGKP